jgi:hypothetical protein
MIRLSLLQKAQNFRDDSEIDAEPDARFGHISLFRFLELIEI